jgi:hypothetical protein
VKNFIMRHLILHSGEHKTAAAHDAMADMGMGHGAGMDPHAMSHDMRNRFWIALFERDTERMYALEPIEERPIQQERMHSSE